MSKHNGKSKLILALASAVLLTSCSEIIAYPNGYDENKLVSNIGEDDENNMESIIYDALHGTSNASTIVVDLVFNKIFDSTFGTLTEIENAVLNNSFNEIVGKYTAYQDKDRTENAAASELEIARVKRVYNRIQTEISDSIRDDISSTNYQTRDGEFSEELFALHVYQNLYSLDPTQETITWSDFTANHTFYEPILLLPDTDFYNKDTGTWSDLNILHISNQQLLEGENDYGYYKDYIEKEYLSDIKQHILTEYYLYNNEYSTLGTRYAREIEYVAIPENSNFPGAARRLCTTFIDQYILNNDDPSTFDFSVLENAWKGYNLGEKEIALLEAAGLTKKEYDLENENVFQGLNSDERQDMESVNYTSSDGTRKVVIWEGTDFGDVAIDFDKIKTDIALTDTAVESTFSDSYTHSYYRGYLNQIQSVQTSDYSTDGWGIKNESFTTLSEITDYGDRLWNIQVANGLIEENGNNYVQKVNIGDESFAFLLPRTLPQNESYPFLHYSNGTYYIVRVIEAASTTRLSQQEDVDGSYTTLLNDGGLKAERVAYEICNILADNSTNKTTALEYYLENSDFIFHDESILEYFKTTYPDVFDE